VREFPTLAREVFDVTGAGDTVLATCALALGAGATLEEATVLANHAAGVAVGKVGTAAVSAAELRQAIQARAARPGDG
jgi:D-beta-D-heptose 7-phosphate kinase/D-beta-D-heptose 1-phosphate adenosyltransferase